MSLRPFPILSPLQSGTEDVVRMSDVMPILEAAQRLADAVPAALELLDDLPVWWNAGHQCNELRVAYNAWKEANQ